MKQSSTWGIETNGSLPSFGKELAKTLERAEPACPFAEETTEFASKAAAAFIKEAISLIGLEEPMALTTEGTTDGMGGAPRPTLAPRAEAVTAGPNRLFCSSEKLSEREIVWITGEKSS